MNLSELPPGNFPFFHQNFKKDLGILLASLLIQLVLAAFLGHLYDTRINLATGYLVGTGQNPYMALDLSSVFHNASFQNISSIGYPPPWPLLLGLIYRITYAALPNLLLYNLATKIPIIAANFVLAYLVADLVRRLNPRPEAARQAWVFMLFNPFLLLATSAWGQIDSIVACLALASLVLLDSGKYRASAVLLALAVSFKPIALPLLLVPLFYLKAKPFSHTLSYYAFLTLGFFFFCVFPFIIFGWDPAPVLHGWNAQFINGGGMSLLVFLELTRDSYLLPGAWQLLGLAWAPALAGAALVLSRQSLVGLKDLLLKSTGLILVFFLTRAWLSEPNLVLVLPFIVILAASHEIKGVSLAAFWILPLLFSLFNTGLAQLFFPSLPGVMDRLLAFGEQFRTLRLLLKIILVIPWQILGWGVVFHGLKKSRAASQEGQAPA